MNRIEIYSKSWCPYCAKAKALLKSKALEYSEVDVTTDVGREAEMVERSGRRSVPQIFIDGEPVGGYDDLAALTNFRYMANAVWTTDEAVARMQSS